MISNFLPRFGEITELVKKGATLEAQRYDTSKTLVRLQGNGEDWWECKSCKNTYGHAPYYYSFVVSPSRNSDVSDFGF